MEKEYKNLRVKLDTSLEEFYGTNFKRYSIKYLYEITGKQRNISKGMSHELNRIFYRQLKLTEDDLLNIYSLMEMKDKGKLKYKQYNCTFPPFGCSIFTNKDIISWTFHRQALSL
ncbi:hypothetical protein [Clostridium kluyveri]|nr:hypothetical protein [Clostridium kluyveri]